MVVFTAEKNFRKLIMPVYDLANSYIRDVQQMLKSKGLLRHEVKKLMNECMRNYDALSLHCKVNDDEANRVFHADYNDMRTETLSKYVKAENPNKLPHSGAWPLYESIRAAIFNQGERDVDIELLTTIECAAVLCFLCQTIFKSMHKQYQLNYGLDIETTHSKLAKCEKEIKMLYNIAERTCCPSSFDYMLDFRVCQAQKVLESYAVNIDDVQKDTMRALDYTPDLKEEVIGTMERNDFVSKIQDAQKNNQLYVAVVNGKVYDDVYNDVVQSVKLSDMQRRGIEKRNASFVLLRKGLTRDVLAVEVDRITKEGKLKFKRKLVIPVADKKK